MKRSYNNEEVDLLSLVEDRSHPILEGFTFDGCTILGPAVVASLGTTSWVENTLSSTMFVVIPEARQRLEGVIGLKDCSLRRCKFVNVGLIGTEDFLRRFFD